MTDPDAVEASGAEEIEAEGDELLEDASGGSFFGWWAVGGYDY